jgi:hypothetical protein
VESDQTLIDIRRHNMAYIDQFGKLFLKIYTTAIRDIECSGCASWRSPIKRHGQPDRH